MTTMFGRCPAVAGAAVGCCACAELVSPTAESAEAATRELPRNSKSRRFIPPLACSTVVSVFPELPSMRVMQFSCCFYVCFHRGLVWFSRLLRAWGKRGCSQSAQAIMHSLWNFCNKRPVLSDRPLLLLFCNRARRSQQLVAATGSLGLLDLLYDLLEVVACRILERRVRNIALEFLQPERLADGQHVPVVDVGCRR
jgi:hypothetical protein